MSDNREEKLKQLALKKAANEMVVMTNGADFIDAIGKKIDALKQALDVDVEVNADDLIEELKKIDAFVPAIDELVKAIDAIEIPVIPEVPDTIKVEGLPELTGAMDTQNKLIAKGIVPTTLEVKGLDKLEQAVKTYAKQLEAAHKAAESRGAAKPAFEMKNIDEVTKRLDDLIDAVAKNTVKQSKTIDDFTPVRRVRLVGNKLIYDDDAWQSGGGGGGAPTVPADDSGIHSVPVVNPDGSKISSGRLVTEPFDYIGVTYPNGTTETYAYKQGGAGGTTIATVTVVYTDSTKEDISSVARA